MPMIKNWLFQEQKKLGTDFLGVATNVRPKNQIEEIRWIQVAGNLTEAYKNIRLESGRGLAGMVWKTGRPQIEEAIFSDVEKLLEYPIARIEKLMSVMAAPVFYNNEVCAVLLIGYRKPHQFSESEKKLFLADALAFSVFLKELSNDYD